MTAFALLQQLHTLGVILTPYPDGTVRCRAPKDILTPELVDTMRQSKAALYDLVEDWSERAAIMEFEAGMPRAEAEACAWAYILESLHPDGGPARASTASGSGCDSGKERRYATCVCKQTV